MLLSKTPPVARWYRVNASIFCYQHLSNKGLWGKHTRSNQSESSAGVDDAGGRGKDRGRSTITNSLVNTPELRCGRSASNWPGYRKS